MYNRSTVTIIPLLYPYIRYTHWCDVQRRILGNGYAQLEKGNILYQGFSILFVHEHPI